MGSPPTSPFDCLEELKSYRRIQESRVRQQVFKEQVTGKVWPHGWRDIQILVHINDRIYAIEMDQQLAGIAAAPQAQPAECKPLSPLAEKVNRLSEVDRHLLRNFGDKFITLLKRRVLGDNNDAEDLEIKPENEKSETPERD
jgi:hypothetical protein